MEADEALTARPQGRRIVLPRLLRRPARILSRIEWRAPRHVGIKGMAVLFLSTAVAGVLIGGHSLTVVSALTAWSGLAIDEVQITGQSETSEVDVLDRLAMGPFPSLVTFDVESARERIEALPWVDQATIRKLYPDTLQVAIAERQPFAIWQDGSGVALIDRSGRKLSTVIGERYARLPMVVGADADKRVDEFVRMIDGVPSLKPRIKAGVLISNRRWNIVLDSGVELLLPANDPADALVQVVALDDGSSILSREIAAIDLRLPSRLVFRLTEAGAAARAALLKERSKSGRKKGSA
ncbi:MAG: FtsQ-type POTRA domain-containing protein [Bauldia sp.]|nr:FtsQ-type POTRA domain-containing protein [Bauldia sp.]